MARQETREALLLDADYLPDYEVVKDGGSLKVKFNLTQGVTEQVGEDQSGKPVLKTHTEALLDEGDLRIRIRSRLHRQHQDIPTPHDEIKAFRQLQAGKLGGPTPG